MAFHHRLRYRIRNAHQLLPHSNLKPLQCDFKSRNKNSNVQNSHVVVAADFPLRTLDAERDEADDGSDPHQTLQTSGQLPGELHVLGRPFGWLQLVGAVALQDLLSDPRGQTLRRSATD